MFCKGDSFYRQYQRMFKKNPIKALKMLRAAKEKTHADIDRAMAHMKPMVAEPTTFGMN